MNRFSRALFTGLLLATITGSAAFADNLQDGKAAFQKEQYAQALELLTPYAKQGNAEAAFLLGEMYGPRSWGQQGENRNGVEQDNKQAIYWWTEAAKMGHAEAQLKLGWWLMYGKGVVDVDQKQAVEWLVKSAEQGNPHAQFEAGLAYAKGAGVTADPVQAFVWLGLASDKDGFEGAAKNRDEIAKTLTPEQLAKAEQAVKDWKPRSTQ